MGLQDHRDHRYRRRSPLLRLANHRGSHPRPASARSHRAAREGAGRHRPVTGLIQSFLTTQPRGEPVGRAGYQSGLNNAPASFIEEDDDSDDDVGKPALGNAKNIDYDSDDKGEEMVGVGGGGGANELIDLGSSESKAAPNIPKLSAPKK